MASGNAMRLVHASRSRAWHGYTVAGDVEHEGCGHYDAIRHEDLGAACVRPARLYRRRTLIGTTRTCNQSRLLRSVPLWVPQVVQGDTWPVLLSPCVTLSCNTIQTSALS